MQIYVASLFFPLFAGVNQTAFCFCQFGSGTKPPSLAESDGNWVCSLLARDGSRRP